MKPTVSTRFKEKIGEQELIALLIFLLNHHLHASFSILSHTRSGISPFQMHLKHPEAPLHFHGLVNDDDSSKSKANKHRQLGKNM